MTARVSVITVVRNGERYLAEALASIVAQTLPPHEIIVVDGQSTDASAAIARGFPTRRVVQEDLGLAQARNLGIENVSGELVAFLDCDDVWAANKLELQARAMCENPALEYTTTWIQYRVEAAATGRRLPRGDLERPRAGATPSALVARRALFERIGGFDPVYEIGCDGDWFTRTRDAGIPTMQLPQVLVYKRLHEKNLSSNAAVHRHELFRIAKQSIARQRSITP